MKHLSQVPRATTHPIKHQQPEQRPQLALDRQLQGPNTTYALDKTFVVLTTETSG
jgi:hypothetical protein